MRGVSEKYRRAVSESDPLARIRVLQEWLRTESRGDEYDSEAVADLIDEWLSADGHP